MIPLLLDIVIYLLAQHNSNLILERKKLMKMTLLRECDIELSLEIKENDERIKKLEDYKKDYKL